MVEHFLGVMVFVLFVFVVYCKGTVYNLMHF